MIQQRYVVCAVLALHACGDPAATTASDEGTGTSSLASTSTDPAQGSDSSSSSTSGGSSSASSSPASSTGDPCGPDGCVCSDGVQDANEECDDGNEEDFDACGVDCTTRCGDGEREVEICFSDAFDVPIADLGRDLFVGALDDDAHLDIAVIEGSSVRLLHGAGDGTFTSGVLLSVPDDEVSALAGGDLDGDGQNELVVGLRASGGMATFRGQGDAWGEPILTDELQSNQHPQHIVLVHIDDDERLDAMVSTGGGSVFSGPPAVRLVAGLASDTFEVRASDTNLAQGTPAAADIDGDGFVDIAVPVPVQNELEGHIEIHWGTGAFELAAPDLSLVVGWGPAAITVADIDADGTLDMVVNDVATSSLHYVLGSGARMFAEPVEAVVGSYPSHPQVGDVDGDGLPDLVVGNSTSPGHVTVGRQLGDFADPFTLAHSLSNYVQAIALEDLDADGADDLIVLATGEDVVQILRFDP